MKATEINIGHAVVANFDLSLNTYDWDVEGAEIPRGTHGTITAVTIDDMEKSATLTVDFENGHSCDVLWESIPDESEITVRL